VEWEYLRILGVIGVLTLILQVGMAFGENWMHRAWRGVHTPTSLGQVFAEWAVFMVLFFLLVLGLQRALLLACSVCNLT